MLSLLGDDQNGAGRRTPRRPLGTLAGPGVAPVQGQQQPQQPQAGAPGVAPANPKANPGISSVPLPPPIMAQPQPPGQPTAAALPPPITYMPPVQQPGATGVPLPPPQTAPQGNASLSTFGPENTLRNQQINPNSSPRLQTRQGQVDQAADSLATGPNRQQLALDTLRLLDEQTGDDRRRGIQDIGRSAASLGRLGSGMVTTDLGNLEDRLQINRDRSMRELATDTAGQELNDRLSRLGALSGLEGQTYGQGLTEREELRGERGYQDSLARDAQDRRERQYGAEETTLDNAERRRLQRLGLTAGVGFSDDPYGVQLGAANGLEGAGQFGLGAAGNLAGQTGGVNIEAILRSLGIGGGGAAPADGLTDAQRAELERLRPTVIDTSRAPRGY